MSRAGQPIVKLVAHSRGYQVSAFSNGAFASLVELDNNQRWPEAVTIRQRTNDGSEFLTRYDPFGAAESHPILKDPVVPRAE
jgi:hypothetical protein